MKVSYEWFKDNLGKIERVKYKDRIINLSKMVDYNIKIENDNLIINDEEFPLNIVNKMDLKVKIHIPSLIGIYTGYFTNTIRGVVTYKEALGMSFGKNDFLYIMSNVEESLEMNTNEANISKDELERMLNEWLNNIKSKYEFINLYFSTSPVSMNYGNEIDFLDIEKVDFIKKELINNLISLQKKIEEFLYSNGAKRYCFNDKYGFKLVREWSHYDILDCVKPSKINLRVEAKNLEMNY